MRVDERKDASRGRPAGTAAFQTTQWSDIRAAAEQGQPGGQEGLAAVCGTYWFPVYAYVRGCGFSPEDAQDNTQGFFLHLMQNGFLDAADPVRGRFRWFLLASLQNFLRNEVHRGQALKRGGGCSVVSWDALEAEQRYAVEPRDTTTPDMVFDRNWARVAMGRALDRLRDELTSNGREALFDQLKSCLDGTISGPAYRDAAMRLGLSTGALKVTVHRMRERFRQLVRIEIAGTVADATEVEDELRHLARVVVQ